MFATKHGNDFSHSYIASRCMSLPLRLYITTYPCTVCRRIGHYRNKAPIHLLFSIIVIDLQLFLVPVRLFFCSCSFSYFSFSLHSPLEITKITIPCTHHSAQTPSSCEPLHPLLYSSSSRFLSSSQFDSRFSHRGHSSSSLVFPLNSSSFSLTNHLPPPRTSHTHSLQGPELH